MSKLILLPPCCNSDGLSDHPESLGLTLACPKGTPAPITLNLCRQNVEEEEVYRLCLPCAEKVERWAEEHNVIARRLNVEPLVGMPCTISINNDCYAAVVTKVSESGNTISVVKVRYKPAPGHNYFGQQKYEYTDEPEGEEKVWTWRRHRWLPKGFSARSGYNLCLGFRRAYLDPHF